MKIYPIGYSTPGARERLDELLADPKILLIDIRDNPWSWSDEWKGEALKARYGEKYHYAGKYLGKHTRIADRETGIRGLFYYIDRGYNLILFCQCKKFNTCHVSSIIDDLLGMYRFEVVHFGEQVQWTQLYSRR